MRTVPFALFAYGISRKGAKFAKGLHAIIGTVTLALTPCAFAQTKVACVGDSKFIGAYPQQLQKLLGRGYEVRTFAKENATILPSPNREFLNSPEFQEATTFEPDAVVVLIMDSGHRQDEDLPMDLFEPALRTLLERFRDTPKHPKVYLCVVPVVDEGAENIGVQTFDNRVQKDWKFQNEFVHPLAIQAAREAGAATIEMSAGMLNLGAPGEREAAERIAEVLAPATIKAHWRIVRTSSFQADEGPPQNAIDGDPDTFWHSEYDPVLAKPPHEIVIDLGESEWLSGFKYLPRQDGGTNGNVRDYEIYVGDTPDSQPTLAAKGTFRAGRNQKIARFKTSVKGRYVRFVCLSEENGQPFASAAELDVIRDPAKN